MKKYILLLLFALTFSNSLVAQNSAIETVSVEILNKSGSSWDGSIIANYPDGEPEITIAKITLPAGFQLPKHKHPTPLGGYILSGELTVVRDDSTSHQFKAGDSIIELVDTWHYGKNEGTVPTVLIAFYIGLKDVPLSINQEN